MRIKAMPGVISPGTLPGIYNPVRLHARPCNRSPQAYEAKLAAKQPGSLSGMT